VGEVVHDDKIENLDHDGSDPNANSPPHLFIENSSPVLIFKLPRSMGSVL